MIDIETLKHNKEILSNKFSGLKIDSIFLEQNGCLSKFFYENERLHELRSCSKILISLAIGIAIKQNMLSLETSVFPIIKKLVKIENEKNIDNIKNWTIKNLLTHSTGYDSQMFSEKFIRKMDKDKLIDYDLNYDMPYKVGEKFTYNNVEPFIISVFFKEKFGVDISDFIN